VGVARPFLHAPSVPPRLKDTSSLTSEQQAEAEEIAALQRETGQIEGIGSATNRILRLCLNAKGFPEPMMFNMIKTLPADEMLLLERVSEHRRMEIAAAARISMKYMTQKTRPTRK
jgi:hypothetical protein